MLYNDKSLRKSLKLPATKIETDSFIGVQLIEKKKTLDFESLAYMAEQVEGAFTFTAMDERNNLYFVKGDNPMCIYHFPKSKCYLYASTEEILQAALKSMRVDCSHAEKLTIVSGDILCIDRNGKQSKSQFDDSHLCERWICQPYSFGRAYSGSQIAFYEEEMWEDLKSVACYYGYSPDDIDRLREEGFSYEELEEALYCYDEV